MKIESIIKRRAGTNVQHGDVKYHFKPEDSKLVPGTPEYLAAPHVAEVEDEGHIAIFLSIREGYRPLRKAKKAVEVQAEVEAPPAPADSGVKLPAGWKGFNKEQLVALAKDACGLELNPGLLKEAMIDAILTAAGKVE